MDLRWTLILAAPVLLALLAWFSWLLFNLIIAKWFGVEGLKATPAVARAFTPSDWAVLPPRRQPSPPSAPAPGTEGGCP
jgi:hypothetical protein